MNGGGWWWPGLLIQLAAFLLIVCGFVWWATWWSVNHVEKHIDKVEAARAALNDPQQLRVEPDE